MASRLATLNLAYDKCHKCKKFFSNSLGFLEHCVKDHSFIIEEVRALYNIRLLYQSSRKSLLCKYLRECGDTNVRIETILSILYDDPSPIIVPFISEQDELLYKNALSQMKFLKSNNTVTNNSNFQDRNIYISTRVNQNDPPSPLLPPPLPPPLLPPLSQTIMEDHLEQSLPSMQYNRLFPMREEDITDLQKRPCECKSEMKVISDRSLSLEEKSISIMYALRSLLEATNPAYRQQSISSSSKVVTKLAMESNFNFSSNKVNSQVVDGVLLDSDSDDDGNAASTFHESLLPIVKEDVPVTHMKRYPFEQNEPQRKKQKIPSESNSLESVLLARLLPSNWLLHGSPRVKDHQIYHPLEDRVLGTDELFRAIGREILLGHYNISLSDFLSNKNKNSWLSLLSSDMIRAVFEKLKEEGLLYGQQDSFYKFNKTIFRKNLEHQLALAEYGLTIDEYFLCKEEANDSQST